VSPFLFPIDEPPGGILSDFLSRISASSNFRIATKWFRVHGLDQTSETDIGKVITEIVCNRDCHEFLRLADEPLEMFLPHVHYRMEQTKGGFEETIARAAADHLGAYSHVLSAATAEQIEEVASTFSKLGPYDAFELVHGNEPGCKDCTLNNGLFSNWFYGVAWDWCFVITWTKRKICVVLCLTDTD
jgi:hypothetical protein